MTCLCIGNKRTFLIDNQGLHMHIYSMHSSTSKSLGQENSGTFGMEWNFAIILCLLFLDGVYTLIQIYI